MAGAISFSGLGSGMDTKSIVDALVNVERNDHGSQQEEAESLQASTDLQRCFRSFKESQKRIETLKQQKTL